MDRHFAWCVCGCCMLLAGCFGPGNGDGNAQPDAGGVSGGSGGISGTLGPLGGRTGGGGSGPVPGTGGVGMVEVFCGDSLCGRLQSPMFATSQEPCCTENGNCSLRSPGNKCVELPASDPRCGPMQVGEVELPGCCTEDGLCGVQFEPLSFHCLSPVKLQQTFGLMVVERPCADPALVDAGSGDGDGDDADAGP